MSKLQGTYQSARSTAAAHKYFIMVFGAVAAALVFTGIALSWYSHSDAARLDLSHPDYRSLRSQIEFDKTEGYLSTGLINEDALDEFNEMFTKQSERATEFDAVGGDVLSDEALGITE